MMKAVRGATIIAVTGFLSACAVDTPSEVETSPKLTVNANEVAWRRFHTPSPRNWVGRFHTEMMERGLKSIFATGIKRGHLCAQLARAFAPPPANDPIWKDAGAFDSADVARAHRKALSEQDACSRNRHLSGLGGKANANLVSNSDEQLTPAGHSYVLQMQAIWQSGANAATMMNAFDAILSEAEQTVDPADMPTLDFLASLTVSSREYWEHNHATLWPQAVVAGGGCNSVSLPECGGGGPQPTSHEFSTELGVYRFASNTSTDQCDDNFRPSVVIPATVGADVGAGWGWAAVAYRIAAVASAGEVAAVASGSAFIGMGVQYVLCKVMAT